METEYVLSRGLVGIAILSMGLKVFTGIYYVDQSNHCYNA